jgi:hypothetical protein
MWIIPKSTKTSLESKCRVVGPVGIKPTTHGLKSVALPTELKAPTKQLAQSTTSATAAGTPIAGNQLLRCIQSID